MRADGAERGGAPRADRLQQAVLEPAAMLVAAFEVEIGRPRLAPALHREAVGAAAFEPDVNDVAHLLIIRRVVAVAEKALRARRVPGIRTLGRKRLYDAVQNGRVTQGFVGFAVDEYGHRHAPGALPADAPIRPPGDHARQPRAPGLRDEFRVFDGLQRTGANVLRPVHADEPLRRGAIDDRCLAAPAMRVGVVQRAARQQPACLLERQRNRPGRLEHMQPGEMRHARRIRAVILHQLRHLDPVGAGQREVFLAMGGCDVHEAGALVGRHVIGRQQRGVMVKALAAQGVRADGAGQGLAKVHVHDVMRGNPGRLANFWHEGERDQ